MTKNNRRMAALGRLRFTSRCSMSSIASSQVQSIDGCFQDTCKRETAEGGHPTGVIYAIRFESFDVADAYAVLPAHLTAESRG